MQKYRGHMYYRLYRALQDEGMDDKDMVFDKYLTIVSDAGFFTIRLSEKQYPELEHFLVWKEKRSWHNSFKLYREFKSVLVALGFIQFIVMLPKTKKIPAAMFKFMAGNKNIKPYAEVDGNPFYILRFGRAMK